MNKTKTEEMTTELPACSKWKVWTGKEVEGEHERGEPTLFVREFPPDDLWAYIRGMCFRNGLLRVWVCEEFFDFSAEYIPTRDSLYQHLVQRLSEIVERVSPYFGTVCLCMRASMAESWPSGRIILPQGFRLYLKLSLPAELLDERHTLCVGPAYADSAFNLGQGIRVRPADYAEDIFLA